MSGGLDRQARRAIRDARRLAVPTTATATDVQPFGGTILDAMDAAGMTGAPWGAWRVFWKAVFALPMTPAEQGTYTRHTDRATPPSAPVREAWQIVGRRGGKSRNAAVGAAYLAMRRDYRDLLAPGERGLIPVIAADRTQAGQVLGYLKGLARRAPYAQAICSVTQNAVEFTTGVVVRVHAASFRTTRGFTVVGLVADEVAFWRSDDSGANPDAEVLGALRPGMATVPDALLLGLSTPYSARGELWRAHSRYFGADDSRTLVWNADTQSMNPTVDARTVAEAFEDDPQRAASEYGQDGRVAFRRDVEALLDPVAVRAVVIPGRHELPRMADAEYFAFVDPSGGSQDAFTLAIAHAEGVRSVLDVLRETRPPFSPDDVVRDYAATLARYGITEVTGDRYAGEWPRERFRAHGVRYVPSEDTTSDLYRELVPLVNGGRVELLDVQRLHAQLLGLERRTTRGGRDTIDHAPGGHDDLANAAAGAAVIAAKRGAGADWREVSLIW